MIKQYSGRKEESTIGIVVSGKHPGFLTLKGYEITKDEFYEEKSAKPTGKYAKELGQGAKIYQRGHMIYAGFMGHTALFCRVRGFCRKPVVGFFPDQRGALSDVFDRNLKAKNGKPVFGAWHNDNWMLKDQAALAFEIPVSEKSALGMRTMLFRKLDAPITEFEYQINQDQITDNHSRNCVAAAIVLLEQFQRQYLCRTPVDRDAKNEITRVVGKMKALLPQGGFKQGHMQQLVQTGFTYLPKSG